MYKVARYSFNYEKMVNHNTLTLMGVQPITRSPLCVRRKRLIQDAFTHETGRERETYEVIPSAADILLGARVATQDRRAGESNETCHTAEVGSEQPGK